MLIQYNTSTNDLTDDLKNVGLNEFGLITCGQKTTAGAPDTTAGKYIAACIIENEGDSTLYFNSGSTAVPVWTPLGSSLSLTRVLTPAEVQAIGTSPITLIAAPGAGLLIVPTIITIKNDFVSTPYVGSGADLSLRIVNNGVLSTIAAVSSNLLLSASSVKYNLGTPAGSGSLVNSNTPVSITNVTGVDPTAGDSPITIYMEYKIITF